MVWTILIVLVAGIAALLFIPVARRSLVSDPLLAIYRRILPPMSQTEQEAIDAGTVWWDGELFSGRPDWAKLIAFPQPRLTAEELGLLGNETEQLCAMASDWETSHIHYD